MTRNYDEEIAAEEEKLFSIKEQMEQTRQKFASVTAESFKTWFFNVARNQAKNLPDVTEQLGDKLSEMKKEVIELQNSADSIATEVLNDDKLWWHRTPGDQYYGFNVNSPPSIIHQQLQIIAGKLQVVLSKYGYKDSVRYHDWSEEMQRTTNEYDRLSAEGSKIQSNIDAIKREKAKKNAETRWDEA